MTAARTLGRTVHRSADLADPLFAPCQVMLPKAPVSIMDICRAAVAISYLHVLYVDGPTLTRLSEHFPKSRWAMRKWTIITGVREYLLGELRHANDRTRIEAKNWIKEEEKKKRSQKMALMFQGVIRKAVAQAKNPPTPKHAETISDLHAAINKRLDAVVAVIEQQSIAQERKIAAIQQALEPLLPSSSQNNTPYQKSRRVSKSKVVDSAGAGSSGSCAVSDQPLERKRSASCGNLAIPQAGGMDC